MVLSPRSFSNLSILEYSCLSKVLASSAYFTKEIYFSTTSKVLATSTKGASTKISFPLSNLKPYRSENLIKVFMLLSISKFILTLSNSTPFKNFFEEIQAVISIFRYQKYELFYIKFNVESTELSSTF